VKDLEIEGRQNEEKCMADIATKIMEIQQLKLKREEVNHLLEDRNKTIQELMDKMEAQKRLISSRDEVIEHLQSMKDIQGGSDEMVTVLREQVCALD
jgi:beta-xylosidase